MTSVQERGSVVGGHGAVSSREGFPLLDAPLPDGHYRPAGWYTSEATPVTANPNLLRVADLEQRMRDEGLHRTARSRRIRDELQISPTRYAFLLHKVRSDPWCRAMHVRLVNALMVEADARTAMRRVL